MSGVVVGETRQDLRVCPVCRPARPLRFIGAWRLLARRVCKRHLILDGGRQEHNEEHRCSSLTEIAKETELRLLLRLPMSSCRPAGLIYERSVCCVIRQHGSFRDRTQSWWLSPKEAMQQEKQDDSKYCNEGREDLRDGTRSHWSHRLRREHGCHSFWQGSNSTARSPI